jgi:DNA repair exonuclease SbcCD ATPase subunit/predicted MPP superfamily phosphohydrolase
MKINVPFKKLKYVCHLADIHIRLFRRHEEYEQVFETLYADILSKNLHDFIIVLAGDIVHAKTDMSPEMVQVTSKFLSRLSDIAPTILIAGNHDCNLANTSRLDALTPIVENLSHPNLYYIRESAVVTVADTSFAVMSIFDVQEHWPSADEIDDTHTKVALYHGPVYGATTDTHYTITDRHVNVDTFKGFDIVMLGDIHKPNQALQESNPIVVYPGSLIQQNFGEQFGNHGWCLWDMPSHTYQFVETHNDYGYVTLEAIDGHITFPAQMPNKARVRLFTGDLDATEVKKLVTVLRNKHTIIEMSVNKSRYTKQASDTSTIQYDALNLTDITTQNSFIIDWLTAKNPAIDANTIENIKKINRDLNSKITHDDHSRNIHWKPLKFTFSNMFSYGENNEIDFTDMHGIYGIFAANASGKSSIADSLMFCLYDKTPRAFKGDHIINNRKDSFTCELLFDINGEQFGIKRTGTRRKNGDVKVDVSFWKVLDTGDILNLNGEDRRDTNANIRSYVGTYEDFAMTALSSQTSNALFIDKSHSERKDLLIQFMGLNVFDKLYDTANDESKEIVGILKRFRKSDVAEQLTDAQEQIGESKHQLAEVEFQYDNLKEERETLDDILVSTQMLKRPVPETSGNKEQLEKNLHKITAQLTKEEDSLTVITNERDTIKLFLEEQEMFLVGFDIIKLKEYVDLHQNCLASLQKERNAVKVLFTKIEEKVKFQTKLQSYKYNSNCDVCVQNNKSVITDLQHVEHELEELNSKMIEHKGVVTKLELEEDFLKPLVSDYEKAAIIQSKIEKAKQTLISLKSNEDVVKLTIEKEKNQITSIEQEIGVYVTNEEAIVYNQKIDEDISEIQNKISTNKKNTQTLEQNIRTLHGTISVLKNKKSELMDKLKEAEQLEVMHDAYTLYLSAIGRDGVPYDLISKIIPHIEGEINSILSQIVDFSVSLEVDGKNINGRITYDNERIWPLENSSGMERFISGLAIRVALMNISNLPKANFLVLDEGFGALDAEHIHSMQTLFNLLKTHFDFLFIVSHLDVMRDMVDSLIEIRREDGYSYISA